MIIDANAYIGHWPFRPLRHNTVDDLLRLMDQHGIDKAVVSSIHAIFYKNSQAGNEELSAQIHSHRDRLFLFATLNPTYVGWREDLERCCGDMDIRGLRLFPYYHDYELLQDESLSLIAAATERGLPVALPMRVVDMRQRHWMDTSQNLSLSEIEAVVRRCPDMTFLILESIGVENSPLANDRELRECNVLFEISRMTSVLQKTLPGLLNALGPSKLLFGTGMPFKYPRPALLKMELLYAEQDVKEQIFYGNMARVLGLDNHV
jgi:predicted TIM-barrel fold metal-dependent hydrolase